jgi:hypothetical protein
MRVHAFDNTIVEEEAEGVAEPFILMPGSPETEAA